MALDRDDETVGGLHGFDRAVVAASRLNKAWGKRSNRLVMEAVDSDLVLAGSAAQLGAGIDLDGVRQVAAAVPPDLVAFEVLQEGSTHRDVDHLLTPADAQDRHIPLASLLKEPELRVIELPVDRPDLRVGLLSVESGVDVPAARQQEAIHLGQ